MMNETSPTGSQLAATSESKVPLGQEQQQDANNPAATFAHRRRFTPNLPIQDLLNGPRENYLRFGVPLYEASITCDWKAARAILNVRPELVRYAITENGETALHIASTVKRSKQMDKFVESLVDKMEEEDLALVNYNFSTALYLAAAAGNLTAVKIMAEKNMMLVSIPGANQTMMPLYAAALFGHYEVVKYLYEHSNELRDDGWNNQNRGWLLEKCVETDMFDVSLEIVKRYSELQHGTTLRILAEKPYAFSETKSNIIKGSITSVLTLIGLTSRTSEKKSKALPLLRLIWDVILQKPKKEIDRILRGPPDLIAQQDMVNSEKVVQALQLQKLINEHLDKLEEETKNIIREPSNAIQQDTVSASRKLNQTQQLEKLISEYLVKMHVETQSLIKKDNKPMFGKKDQALELQDFVPQHIVSMHHKTRNTIERTFGNEDKTKELQELINQNIRDMRAKTKLNRMNIEETHSSRVLFIAAEMGNTVFLVELIRRYPDLIWKVNDNGQTIFHIAVKNRSEGIYILLYDIGSMKDFVTPLKDVDDNNMLHLAGKLPTENTHVDVSGAALWMQRELLWFEEIRSIVPPSYQKRKNKDGLTPQELFTKEHKKLVAEGERWMKETANQCMVVAALIATIVFAAAFTFPGGYNETNGIPIFYRKPVFVAFVVADAISLFLSSTSILTFLSILTCRYAERDFVESLPKRLMLGVSTLFFSIIAMMITFSVSFFILYQRKEMRWIPILIGVGALMPIVLYVVLQHHVLFDLIRLTYGSKYIFKPRKQYLYYANPKV